jgi:hypothetical protein
MAVRPERDWYGGYVRALSHIRWSIRVRQIGAKVAARQGGSTTVEVLTLAAGCSRSGSRSVAVSGSGRCAFGRWHASTVDGCSTGSRLVWGDVCERSAINDGRSDRGISGQRWPPAGVDRPALKCHPNRLGRWRVARGWAVLVLGRWTWQRGPGFRASASEPAGPIGARGSERSCPRRTGENRQNNEPLSGRTGENRQK